MPIPESPLIIPTENPDLTLRELTTIEDDQATLQIISRSRQHIGAYGGKMGEISRFTSVKEVTSERMAQKSRGGILLGGWLKNVGAAEELAGNVTIFPNFDGIEIGGWAAEQHTQKGLAGTAIRAATPYALSISTNVYTKSLPDNQPSLAVIKGSGFRFVQKTDTGHYVFKFVQGS